MDTPGPYVSVDASAGEPADNGYLENAREYLKTLHNSVQTHRSTAEAVANLAGGQDVHLVGHGRPGWISTGSGRVDGADTSHMAVSSSADWAKRVSGSGWRSISLWSCSTGCGLMAPAFLDSLAERLGGLCYALTGDLVCNAATGFTPVGAAVWVMASPESPASSPDCAAASVSMLDLPVALFVSGRQVSVERTSVRNVSWQTPTLPKIPLPPEQCLAAFDFARPLNLGGAPAGRQTAALWMQVTVDSRLVEKRFAVYNHSLLWDRQEGVYYARTVLLQPLIAGLRA